MQRRDFVKAMMAASVTARAALGQQTAAPAAPPPPPQAPGPLPWMRGLMEAKPLPVGQLTPDAVAQTDAHFFSPQQFATLRHLGEILQPPYKGYPGATEAGTPEFLDFLISASPADRQQMYQSGLDRLESEAKQHFGKSFAAIDISQADQLLRPWLRTWLSDHPPTEPYALFINIVHTDIRTATMNSQAWSDAAHRAGQQTPNIDLYWYPVDPDLRRNTSNNGRN
ncbi:gluconate 2-dehydrogenase subunit 3 family protein [Acidicapsa acidisoli]|uniref:gluconate 2-dehydrogenase subunit 3 family protein n=1 Tax=Acidicapsa acidisoli TaxID=1615681 RepID=UPI0021DFAE71|nr:gluconate 2-dehydrogenase subunit 3 family protein [Acidicapsa acidisoli]